MAGVRGEDAAEAAWGSVAALRLAVGRCLLAVGRPAKAVTCLEQAAAAVVQAGVAVRSAATGGEGARTKANDIGVDVISSLAGMSFLSTWWELSYACNPCLCGFLEDDWVEGYFL